MKKNKLISIRLSDEILERIDNIILYIAKIGPSLNPNGYQVTRSFVLRHCIEVGLKQIEKEKLNAKN